MTALLHPEEHVLSTLERDGSRRWIQPRLSKGTYWRARSIVAYALVALFVALPHIRIAGKPAILLDIVHRRFTFFGFTFLPTDTLLLALFLVTVFLSIFLLTALLGRVWCGWACPQTVYMEFFFRPLERWFEGTKGMGGAPRRDLPAWRSPAKYLVYLLISMALAHTFLAYFVGVDRLSQWIRQSPIEHPTPFLVMAGTTVAMLFDFCFFREQLCLIACPYGRFQSVLLDRRSLIVAYDKRRGEPRGKLSKSLPVIASGDCIDCGACVRTCPTGIDIRQGLQMECIHCTQCMDACDAIMTKVDRPTGLIRYSTQSEIDGGKKSVFRPRLVIYPVALVILVAAFVTTLMLKQPFDVTVLRNFGMPFVVTADGTVQNIMRIKIVNRLDRPLELEFHVSEDSGVRTDVQNQKLTVDSGAMQTQPVLFTAPSSAFVAGQLDAQLTLRTTNGKEQLVTCRLLGPSPTHP